jgi:streptogramin lyase
MKLKLFVLLSLILSSCWLAPVTVSAGPIETVAGNGQPGNNGDAGPALEKSIDQPFGVEVGPDGALYVTEVGAHRVRRVDLKSGQMTTVAGNGKKGYSGDGGPATAAMLAEPYEVRFDRAGNLIFVEMVGAVVRKVDKATGKISTIAGTGKAGFSGDGGPATEATFRQPHSIALDSDDNIYIADIGNHRIRRVDAKTGIVTTIVGNGEKQLPKDGSTAEGGPIHGPRALFIDGPTMWIALREGNTVWRLDLPSGKITHIAGTGKRGFTGDNGPAKECTFDGPKGIAVGPKGEVVVVDTENQAIREIDVAKGTVRTVAGMGPKARGFGGDGGPATMAKMDRPHGCCVGRDGAIFIGDTNTHRVRRVLP